MRFSKVTGLIITISVFFAAGLFILNFQSIYDWYRLRGYQPPASIAKLADDSAMTDLSRKLFYVNRPELNDKETFRQNCTSAEASIVLGCYVSNTGIYIYDVQDDRLAGIEEVTAAHEMLHVAYERLDDATRQKIDALTAEAFNNLKNPRIAATVEQYRKTDESVVPNELHSILGTEVAQLPPALEEHYAEYFSDRAVVVSLAERYEKAFTAREAKIAKMDKQLAALDVSIKSAQAEIDGLNQELQLQRKELDAALAANNASVYNAGVPVYNAAVQEYNQLVADTRDEIARYNQIVKERNALALEERDLYKSLDSRTVPQESG